MSDSPAFEKGYARDYLCCFFCGGFGIRMCRNGGDHRTDHYVAAVFDILFWHAKDAAKGVVCIYSVLVERKPVRNFLAEKQECRLGELKENIQDAV